MTTPPIVVTIEDVETPATPGLELGSVIVELGPGDGPLSPPTLAIMDPSPELEPAGVPGSIGDEVGEFLGGSGLDAPGSDGI